MSNSVRPHRRQPTRLPHPWDSTGKNTGVGCHVLLPCMKVKRESEVAQSCLTLSDPMDCSLPGSSIHGIFQARVLEWGDIAFSVTACWFLINLALLKLRKWKKVLEWPLDVSITLWLPVTVQPDEAESNLSRRTMQTVVYRWFLIKMPFPFLIDSQPVMKLEL